MPLFHWEGDAHEEAAYSAVTGITNRRVRQYIPTKNSLQSDLSSKAQQNCINMQ